MDYRKNEYELLITKLDEFIRKYYKNQLLKGAIYSGSILLAFYLSVVLLEYFGHFNTIIRTALFYIFILSNAIILIQMVLVPLLKINRLGKIISYEQAAEIIGKHFREVNDQLLNTLQLRQQEQSSGASPQSRELLLAGISQKIKALQPIPFTAAINLKKNRRYLKYLVLPALMIAGIVFTAPSVITESTARLIEHRTFYEQQAPFKFIILNKNLQAIQHEDFRLDIRVNGNELPDQVYIETDGNRYRIDKENVNTFHYDFKNLQKSLSFRLYADTYFSGPYELTALPMPTLVDFNISLDYPPYLHKKNEVLQNTGDLIIPAGTHAQWALKTTNTDNLNIRFSDSTFTLGKKEKDRFIFAKTFLRSNTYTISASNQYLHNKDSVIYTVSVLPDLYPSIDVEASQDSLSSKLNYFRGIIKDDYGFSALNFKYRFLKKQGSGHENNLQKALPVPVNLNINQEQFFYFFDWSALNPEPGDEIEYYFEVWDNDGVSGSKSTRSQAFLFQAPSLKEIEKNADKNNADLQKELKESIRDARELQKDMQDIQKKLFEKKNVAWEDKKQVENLLNRQKELEKKVNDIQKQSEQNFRQQSEYQPPDQELLEKQKALQQLVDQVMPDEMKQQLEELQKLLDQTDKQKTQEMLDQMKLSNKDLEKELDRALELFKQLEFEQKLDNVIKNLDKLSQSQENLSKESLEKKDGSQDLLNEQKQDMQDFQEITRDMKDLEQKNEQMEHPNGMENTEKEQQDIQKDMQQGEKELEEKKNKKASQSQKSASGKMQQLSQKMKQMQSKFNMEQASEDIAALRALLENLLKLSFEQERLMNDLKNTDISDPRYLKISQQQRKLKDDATMIEDSLFALSKRVVQIESLVNREVSDMNQNMDKSLRNLEDRQVMPARTRQQYVMTSANNLALLLNEILNQLESQMQNMMPGSGSCNKPGGKSPKPAPSAARMRQMQEELNKQMEQLKNGMMKKDGKGGGPGMSEQLARLAAQQQALRNELQKLNMKENKAGKGRLGDLDKIAREMEQAETDLVNKIISQETLKRQQEILTRLLEAEKAEREREQDEKRESNEAKPLPERNPPGFEQYKKLKGKEMELLRTVPPSLNPYYKTKVNEYFQSIEK